MTERQAEYFSPHPKLKPYRNPDYLKFIRKQACGGSRFPGPCESHHVRRSYWGAGVSQKPHDYVAVPRLKEYHMPEYEGEPKRICREICGLMLGYIETKWPEDAELAYRELVKTLMEYIESKRKLTV